MGPQGAHQPDELDRQVLADDLEHPRVVLARHAGPRPPELDDSEHLRAEIDGDRDKRAVRRDVLHEQGPLEARIDVEQREGGRSVGAVHGDDGQAACTLLPQHVCGDPRTVGYEFRDIGARKAVRDTAELEASALSEVERGPIGLERVDELVEHVVDQRGEVFRTGCGHDDGQRAGKTRIRRPELCEQALGLTVVGALLLEALQNDEHAVGGSGIDRFDRRMRHVESAHANRNKRAVGKLQHAFVVRAIEAEREAVIACALEHVAEQEIFDVLADNGGTIAVKQREQLTVGMENRAVGSADGDSVARDLDDAGQLGELDLSHSVHGTSDQPGTRTRSSSTFDRYDKSPFRGF